VQTKPKTRTKILPIIITLCATLILLAAVGGWVYVQRQQLAQHDRELVQQKQLKEEEIKTEKAAAQQQADATRAAARCAAGNSPLACL
jgi:uncharacterized protein HemX